MAWNDEYLGHEVYFKLDLAVANRGEHAPGPVKISHKKMATEDGRIDFMFLAPAPHPAAGSATV